MTPSGQMVKARARWARARAARPTKRPSGLGVTPGVGIGIMFVGVVGLLMLATLATTPRPAAARGLSGTGRGVDKAGQDWLYMHQAELNKLLGDVRSGDPGRRKVAMKQYDRLVKKAPRSVKMELIRHHA